MGITEDKMPTWVLKIGSDKELKGAKIILWHGFCSVHKRFTVEQVNLFREKVPDGLVVVHPECPKETVELAMQTALLNSSRIMSKICQVVAKLQLVLKSTWSLD